MRFLKTCLASLLLFACAAMSVAQQPSNWVQGWMQSSSSTGTVTTSVFTAADNFGYVYMVARVTEANKPDAIKVIKYNAYGVPVRTTSLTSSKTGVPIGFAVDSIQDTFLLYQDTDANYNENAVLDGWNAGGAQIVHKTYPNDWGLQTNSLFTDASNNLFVVLDSSNEVVQYIKMSRTGTQAFSNTADIYTDYVQFDPTGRACVVGYLYGGATTSARAIVFNSQTGAIDLDKQLAYTSTKSYYFGGANFDSAGDLFLNTNAADQNGNNPKATIDCYSKTYSKLWEAMGISAFAWYGTAADPNNAYVWGSSDLYNSSGFFVADVSGGKIGWQQPSLSLRAGFVDPGQDSGPTLHNKNFDGVEKDVNGDIVFYSDNVQTGVPREVLRLSGAHVTLDLEAQTITITRPNGTITLSISSLQNSPSGSGMVYTLLHGILLDTLTGAANTPSGGSIALTVGLNLDAPSGGRSINLASSSGTFPDGRAVATVAIASGHLTTSITLKTPPTNVNTIIQIVAKESGVLRTLTVTETAPKIKTIAANLTVTAATDTTDPFTVTLDGVAATGGIPVTITSSNTAVIPNGSATVLAGNTAVSGSLAVKKVTTQTVVTVTFKTSTGSSMSKAITVKP